MMSCIRSSRPLDNPSALITPPCRLTHAAFGKLRATYPACSRLLSGLVVCRCHSLGQDKPLSAVDELTRRVEMTGVTGGLRNHVQHNLPQRVKPPVAEEFGRPPGRRGVQ